MLDTDALRKFDAKYGNRAVVSRKLKQLCTDNTITGDLTPIDFDPNTEGIQTQPDEWGNIKTDSSQQSPSRADTLYDTSGNDLILGGGGDDTIFTVHGGSDRIQSGEGNDALVVDEGNNLNLPVSLHGADYIDGCDGDYISMKLTDASTTQPVIVKDGNDLYVFIDSNNYMKIASEFQTTNYGIERLEVSDGHYITRDDIQTIVDTMSSINNNTGLDVIRKYTEMMNDQQYQNILATSWHR